MIILYLITIIILSPYKSAYKRAQETFEKIKIERRKQKDQLQMEKKKRIDSMKEYQSIKQKMNKALSQRNKKGQPKLNAQVAVLLEKIQRRVAKS